MDIKLEDGIEIPEGHVIDRIGSAYEGDICLTASGEVFHWATRAPSTAATVILKKKFEFVWPEWFKGEAIVKEHDSDGYWYGCKKIPYFKNGWHSGIEYVRLDTSLFNIEFPDVEPKDSLILRPDLRGDK